MTFGSSLVAGFNSGPFMTDEKRSIARRRGFPIMAYVGANGAGKSLIAALDTLPTLRGISWSCDNPDHIHTRRGQTQGVRRVLSTMRFTTPTGADHPLWLPLDDYSKIIHSEHVDMVLDEVGGAVASSTGDDIPIGVKASLQELRRRDVLCRWTAPSWARASKVLREVSQGVTLVVSPAGGLPVVNRDGIRFEGPHESERLSLDGESLDLEECSTEGEHFHDAGRIWGARRLMYARSYDATVFDEWTTAKKEKVKPEVRQLFWRPGSAAENAYDTHAFVEKLGQITGSGTCDHCGGHKTRPKCTCNSPAASRRAQRQVVAQKELEDSELENAL